MQKGLYEQALGDSGKEKLILTGRNFSRTRLGERQPSVMTGGL